MWKTLKGLFIEEGEVAKPARTLPDKRTKGTTAKQPDSAPATSPTSKVTTAATTGNVNDRSLKVLLEALEAVNLPGFDYLEYKKSLENLRKMNFSEEVRYQTAFTAAQSMGVTSKQLIDSAQHYLKALETEERKFSTALAGQREKQLTKRQEELKVGEEKVAELEREIEAMRERVAERQQRQQQLRSAIEKSTQKLDQTERDFAATLAIIRGGIEQDVTKAMTYLK